MRITLDGSDQIPEADVQQLIFKLGERTIIHTPSSLWKLVDVVMATQDKERYKLVYWLLEETQQDFEDKVNTLSREGYSFTSTINMRPDLSGNVVSVAIMERK